MHSVAGQPQVVCYFKAQKALVLGLNLESVSISFWSKIVFLQIRNASPKYILRTLGPRIEVLLSFPFLILALSGGDKSLLSPEEFLNPFVVADSAP